MENSAERFWSARMASCVRRAHVQIAGSTLWPARTADASADGRVRISALPAGSYALRATSGALVSATDLGIPRNCGEKCPVLLTLLPGVFAAARVVDGEADDAAPVGHARVTLVEAGGRFPLEVMSDDAGSARLAFNRSPFLLNSWLRRTASSPAARSPSPRTATPYRLCWSALEPVEGRVFDGRGRPVDGATIEIVGSSPAGDPIRR